MKSNVSFENFGKFSFWWPLKFVQIVPKGSELSFMVKSVGVGGGDQLHPHPQSQLMVSLGSGTKAWLFIKKESSKINYHTNIFERFKRSQMKLRQTWEFSPSESSSHCSQEQAVRRNKECLVKWQINLYEMLPNKRF